ncbi:hypothetical protein JCM13991_03750 [Thermodesulfovibrio hydrogeniphilus]
MTAKNTEFENGYANYWISIAIFGITLFLGYYILDNLGFLFFKKF